MDSGSPIIKGAVGVRGREAGITGDQGQEGLRGGASARLSRRGGSLSAIQRCPKDAPVRRDDLWCKPPGLLRRRR